MNGLSDPHTDSTKDVPSTAGEEQQMRRKNSNGFLARLRQKLMRRSDRVCYVAESDGLGPLKSNPVAKVHEEADKDYRLRNSNVFDTSIYPCASDELHIGYLQHGPHPSVMPVAALQPELPLPRFPMELPVSASPTSAFSSLNDHPAPPVFVPFVPDFQPGYAPPAPVQRNEYPTPSGVFDRSRFSPMGTSGHAPHTVGFIPDSAHYRGSLNHFPPPAPSMFTSSPFDAHLFEEHYNDPECMVLIERLKRVTSANAVLRRQLTADREWEFRSGSRWEGWTAGDFEGRNKELEEAIRREDRKLKALKERSKRERQERRGET
uniref:Probable awr type III effector family protein n=1 Tax=Ganoderma boninense TaxID=34458 RepID=A0A5K1K5S6_9APHY|nr:Probable awr type III effector family protein [Ganoderma boninense]